MGNRWIASTIVSALLLGAAVTASAAEDVVIAPVGKTLYLSGIYGSDPDPIKQVDEVIRRAHAALAKRGLGFGAMAQHTIFLKDGALSPMAVLQRFHGESWKVAPSLKEHRSVGTIIRVPAMPGNAVVMLEMVAGVPTEGNNVAEFPRVPFKFGPAEIAETIDIGGTVYTAGLEAMDFEHGTLAPDLDAQMNAIVGKLNAAFKGAGLTLADMVAHNLYVKKGTDPMRVIELFHKHAQGYAPALKDKPSVGTLGVVDGMAGDGFLMEMDAIAVRPTAAGKPVKTERVAYDKPGPIARSLSVGDATYVSGDTGTDPALGGQIPQDVGSQLELAVRNIGATLKKSGNSLNNLAKVRIFLKNGTADPQMVRQKFNEIVQGQAPLLDLNSVAQTLLLVEGLDDPKASVEISAVARRR